MDPLVLPLGTIIMWDGPANTIPAGYAICDGGNGTPDLREKFVRGGGPRRPTGTIKEESSQIAIPSHQHGAGTLKTVNSLTGSDANANHWHSVNTYTLPQAYPNTKPAGNTEEIITETVGPSGHAFSGLIEGAGTNHVHTLEGQSALTESILDLTPYFYAVYFIMRVSVGRCWGTIVG